MQDPGAIAYAGFISLLLTLVNIAFIFIVACMMFWCKSVVKYEGESSGWQNEYQKYKAANEVIRNDQQGRVLAKRAAWVAKLYTGLEKKSATDKVKDAFCCGCFGGGDNVAPKLPPQKPPNITVHGINGAGGKHNTHDMTPHIGSRPMANTLFGMPEEEEEGTPTLPEALIISNAVTMGAKQLDRMMSQHKLSNSDNGNVNARTTNLHTQTTTLRMQTTDLAHTSSMRQRKRPGARPRRTSFGGGFSGHTNNDLQPLGGGKSLFASRRNKHNQEEDALRHAAEQFVAMAHGHHARKLTHSQYLDVVALEEVTGHTGLTPHASFVVPARKYI
jgi:hypothetical protein